MNNYPICFYHSGDMDGICSASIVKKAIGDVELYGIDYQDIPNFPWNKIHKNREVIMVDFSLPRESMERIKKNCPLFIWIDHHKTAINEMRDLMFYGLRSEQVAACELTWNYFFPSIYVPKLIRLIGSWDIWDFSNPKTELFHYGIESYYIDPNYPEWLDFNIDEIIEKGHNILNYQTKLDKEIIKMAFPTSINGYKAIAINAPHGSKKFNQLPNKDEYEIYICFVLTDESTYRVSLYTEKNNIDVGEIAKLYNGGGHKNAAGFIWDSIVKLPWT